MIFYFLYWFCSAFIYQYTIHSTISLIYTQRNSPNHHTHCRVQRTLRSDSSIKKLAYRYTVHREGVNNRNNFVQARTRRMTQRVGRHFHRGTATPWKIHTPTRNEFSSSRSIRVCVSPRKLTMPTESRTACPFRLNVDRLSSRRRPI